MPPPGDKTVNEDEEQVEDRDERHQHGDTDSDGERAAEWIAVINGARIEDQIGILAGERPAPPEIKDAKVALKLWTKDGTATTARMAITARTTSNSMAVIPFSARRVGSFERNLNRPR